MPNPAPEFLPGTLYMIILRALATGLRVHAATPTAPVIIPTTASSVVSFVVRVVIVRPSRSTVIRSQTANTSGREVRCSASVSGT